MGKCVSKDQQLKIREIDERSYIAITDEFEYYQYDGDDDGSEDYYYGGQTESKKKKMPGRETKGTSISFGFKKNKNLAANKTLNIINNNREKEEQQKATIISNLNVISEHNNFINASDNNNDNNGNTTSTATNIQNEEKEVRTVSPARLQPAKRDQLAVGRSNRFGFRQNAVRPTSSFQPRIGEFSDNLNNNTTQAVQADKNRAKSATVTSQRTNIPAQPIKLEQKSPTDVIQQSELNANTNVNLPTPQSVILSRYTLYSTSLPRPQFPVSVKMTAPSSLNSVRSSTTYTMATSRPASSSSVQNKLIDTKGAKHQANLSKQHGGLLTRRDESLDSGIHSHDSTGSDQQMEHPPVPMKRITQQQRSRRLEMIPIPGRHKFEIRDLNEFSENRVVVPLSLPKLPTDRKEIVTNGLIRSTNSYNAESDMDMSISGDSRPTSFISTTSETESFEEEKQKLDISSSEKSSKGAISKQTYTITSSMSSQKLAFLGITGESLAVADCSSISTSITTDDEMNKNTRSCGKKDIDCDEDEMSSTTLTPGYSGYLNSSLSTSKTMPSKDQKETVNDAFLKQQQAGKIVTICRKELFIDVDEKFAETVEATKNLALLDDETSPSESLVSSSDSGDVPMKKTCDTKPIEEAKEDLEDITPELVDDLVSPGSPTHASNSLSLSDGGRDFLIDDEIADQPGLMFNDKNHKGSPSHHDDYKSIATNSEATPTLRDISAHGSIRSLNKLQQLKTIQSGQSSPAVIKKTLERSGSLDTLSPCDSIASDDLMADFDLASSIDSIDRHEQLFDELKMHSEIDGKTNGSLSEFDGIFRSPLNNNISRRSSNRESITSQLPARATRLLNRRLQSGSNNSPLSHHGSESPRSLDSVQSRTSSARASLREHLKQRQQLNLQSHLVNSSNEDLFADKSLRNAMLQDVVSFKKQLVQLRRVLQEDEEKLMRSDTLNPFEMNGQFFSNLNVNGIACENNELMPNGNDKKEKYDDEKNIVLTAEQLLQLEDQRQELADLRRQVVFLQSQIDDKDRTIKLQQNKLEQLEKAQQRNLNVTAASSQQTSKTVEMANCATQTERLRPMSMGQDFTSPLEATPKMNGNVKQPIPTITVKSSPPRSKTQISSVYTKLSSIKPTTQTSTSLNCGAPSATANNRNSSSIPTTNHSAKPMKTTKIEHPSPLRMQSAANVIRNDPIKSPLRRTIPQPSKLSATSSSTNKTNKNQTKSNFASPSQKAHLDDSNGNSATSSLSTSSSNSSLNTSPSGIVNSVPTLANQLNSIYNRGLIE